MINLLPPEVKSGYVYAKRNVSLRRWVVLFVLALIGLAAIGTYGMLSLHQSNMHYQKQIASSEDLFKQEKYTETQAKIKDIAGSFKLVVQVLGQEVLFSQLIKQIGASVPANANLTGLTIAQNQTGIDIFAVSKDYKTATQVQINLADPANKIFTKADIVNIVCDDGTTATSSPSSATTASAAYPCKVKIRALFGKDNPFLFISPKAKKS